jgi:transcriptional regulator with XRE-family HTH domain
MTRGSGNPHVRRRETGAALRKMRAETEWSVEAVARHLDCSPVRVTRLEEGIAALRYAEARDLLDLYHVVGDTRLAFLGAVRELGARNWWYPYADLINDDLETLLILEDEASFVITHQPSLVPGLLQTYRYCWELISTVSDLPLEEVERRVKLRTARQRVLVRDPAPRMTIVLGEAALRRPVGGPDVMREQYERLIDVAVMPATTLRILPLSAGPHQAMGFTFQIFEFEGDDPGVMQIQFLDRERFAYEAEEVGHYTIAYDEASRRALDPQASLAFLRELAGRG